MATMSTPLPSKLLENAVHYQVSKFLEEDVLLDQQHGFRRKHNSSAGTVQARKEMFDNSL